MRRSSKPPFGLNATSLGAFGVVFILGIAIGIAFSSTTTLSAGNVASSFYIDNSAPDPELCAQYGASAIVMETHSFVTLNPFSVYTSQPKMRPGCVLRRNNWAILEQRKLVRSDEVRDCRRRLNTFGYTGQIDGSPEIDCIYQTSADKNDFPSQGGAPQDVETF